MMGEEEIIVCSSMPEKRRKNSSGAFLNYPIIVTIGRYFESL
jgi:hypothetical protein